MIVGVKFWRGRAVCSLQEIQAGTMPARMEHGVLTTAHAASSYGMPILLDMRGEIVPPSMVDAIHPCDLSDAEIEAGRAAGYRI